MGKQKMEPLSLEQKSGLAVCQESLTLRRCWKARAALISEEKREG